MADIDDTFKEQNKEYSFRQPEIKKYRKKAQKKLKTPLEKRLNKILKNDFPLENITEEKLERRDFKEYGKKNFLKLERFKKGVRYVARNKKGKFITWFKVTEPLSEEELKEKMFKRLKERKFNYKEFYVLEDSEPLKKGDPRKTVTVSYNTYFRYGILIYRLSKSGKRYEVIYQDSNSQAKSVFIPYQRIIAGMKEEILRKTGLTLEEWLYINQRNKNIFVEGGLKYTRFKNTRTNKGVFKKKKDYEFSLDFSNL